MRSRALPVVVPLAVFGALLLVVAAAGAYLLATGQDDPGGGDPLAGGAAGADDAVEAAALGDAASAAARDLGDEAPGAILAASARGASLEDITEAALAGRLAADGTTAGSGTADLENGAGPPGAAPLRAVQVALADAELAGSPDLDELLSPELVAIGAEAWAEAQQEAAEIAEAEADAEAAEHMAERLAGLEVYLLARGYTAEQIHRAFEERSISWAAIGEVPGQDDQALLSCLGQELGEAVLGELGAITRFYVLYIPGAGVPTPVFECEGAAAPPGTTALEPETTTTGAAEPDGQASDDEPEGGRYEGYLSFGRSSYDAERLRVEPSSGYAFEVDGGTIRGQIGLDLGLRAEFSGGACTDDQRWYVDLPGLTTDASGDVATNASLVRQPAGSAPAGCGDLGITSAQLFIDRVADGYEVELVPDDGSGTFVFTPA